MLSLRPIAELLKPKPPTFAHHWFRDIGGAAEYAQVLETKLPLPMAWVLRMVENNTTIGEAADDDAITFDVVIGIENVRRQNSFELDDELNAYRNAVYKRLRNQEITGGIRPIRYNGGIVINYSDGELLWRDRYTLDAMLTNYLPDPAPPAELFTLTQTGSL